MSHHSMSKFFWFVAYAAVAVLGIQVGFAATSLPGR
jgi:hypothetical protein